MSDKVKAKKANPPFKRTRKGRTRSSRVSSKNQVTIPVEILRQAGIAPNELVNFKFNKSGEIVISKEGSALESLLAHFLELMLILICAKRGTSGDRSIN